MALKYENDSEPLARKAEEQVGEINNSAAEAIVAVCDVDFDTALSIVMETSSGNIPAFSIEY